MNRPTWDNFIAVNSGDKQNALEALARMLFKSKYNLKDNLAYFKNHAGNETNTILVDGQIIGFQAKYFDGAINGSEIIESMRKAKKNNPSQTIYIIYTNGAFGNPRNGNRITAAQQNIEDEANDLGLTIEWWYGDNILDAVSRDPLIYDLFFNPDTYIRDLAKHIEYSNESKFSYIQTKISSSKGDFHADRSLYHSDIGTFLKEGKNVLISGESGSGKSAIIKEFIESRKTDDDSIFYVVNASQFKTSQINDLFSLHRNYNIVDFCRFFENTKNKVVVIDSAEKILEIENDIVFTMFINELNKHYWKFIFTCRAHSQTEFLKKTDDLFGISIETVNVDALTKADLELFAKQYEIQLPNDIRLKDRLGNLFYLARYVELNTSTVSTLNLSKFREEVWQHKVKGNVKGALAQYREECLLALVKYQVVNGTYYIPKQGINHEAAYALIQDDVLVDFDRCGYAIKHDIYVEWALDYLIDISFNNVQGNAQRLISECDTNIQTINAFNRWFANKIEDGDDSIAENFTNLLFNDSIPEKWKGSIVSCICKSSNYAPNFFRRHHNELIKDNYKWLNRIISIMIVSCQEVTNFFKYNGKTYPVFTSIGSGWAAAVDMVYNEGDNYYYNNTQFIQPLCDNFRKVQRKPDIITREGGLLVLKIFEMQAEAKKRGELFHFSNPKVWCDTLLSYSAVLSDKIKRIFEDVIEYQWFDIHDPYYDFVSHIAKIEHGFFLLPLITTNKQLFIDLIEGLWFYQRKEDDSYYTLYSDREYYFGMNHWFLDLTYMPASALQTPFYALLCYENKLASKNKDNVLESIIKIVNRATKEYIKHPFSDDSIYEVEIGQPNGTFRKVFGSYGLWNMYRGTSGFLPPYALQSIHMALEKYLLELMKDKGNQAYVKSAIHKLMSDAHACSLIAIVASIVTAYPDEFYDESLWLLQDLRILSFDMMRYNREISANDFISAFREKKDYWTERVESKELKHRKRQLENLLTSYQVIYDNDNSNPISREKLDVLGKIVDKLKDQLVEIPDQEREIFGFIIARVDYKSMLKKEVKLQNGVNAIQIEPALTEEQRNDSERIQKANKEMLRGINLRMWIEYRANKSYDKAKIYPYENNPSLVLSEVDKIIKQLHEQENGFLLPGDEFLPAMACAILFADYSNLLNEEQKVLCKDIVGKALSEEGFLTSSPLSGFEICLNALPVIIDLYPEDNGEWRNIIIYYASHSQGIGNYRTCDKVRWLINHYDMWNKYHDLMADTLSSYVEYCESKECKLSNIDIANTIMSLIPSGTLDIELRTLAKKCMDELSLLWQKKDNGYYIYSNDRLFVSDVIADYILMAPADDIEDLSRPFARFLNPNENYGSLLDSFLVTCAEKDLYCNFWKVWEIFYPAMIANIKYTYASSNLNALLLNPSFLHYDNNDWFKLDKDNINFFKQAAQDIAYHPSCILSIARVYSTIGQKYYMDAIPVIYNIIQQEILRMEDYKKSIVFYLDQIMMNVFTERRDEINKNISLRSQIEGILNFLVNQGSKEAMQHLLTL